MNPNLLKQLAIIVKQGSISGAAEQLYITQPTLTRAIQQLESRVGAPVLKRTRYGVVPTEIGARLAQIGERILQDANHGDEVIRQFHCGYQNEFALGVDPLWEFATVDTMTDRLLKERDYVFHLRTGSAAVQIALLQQGQLDFLLAPAYLSVAQGELEREILFRDRAAVFAGQTSELIGARGPLSTASLSSHKWIIAGASAGFLDNQQQPVITPAAQMAFTGSIRSVLYLLRHRDILVRLPARLTLMTGEVTQAQMLAVSDASDPRRDIALWYRSNDSARPEFLKVCQRIKELVCEIDAAAPTFGLDL